MCVCVLRMRVVVWAEEGGEGSQVRAHLDPAQAAVLCVRERPRQRKRGVAAKDEVPAAVRALALHVHNEKVPPVLHRLADGGLLPRAAVVVGRRQRRGQERQDAQRLAGCMRAWVVRV